MATLNRLPNVANLKRKRSSAINTGAFEGQLKLGTTAWTGKGDTHRIHRQFQPAFTGLAGGLYEAGLGHLWQGCGVRATKGNPAMRWITSANAYTQPTTDAEE
jgi:hypothetical protein